MNMRSRSIIATCGLCLALATGLTAAEPAMAFVSMERLFDEYYKTKAANIQLKARFETVETPRRELLEKVKLLKDEVEKLGIEMRDKSISDTEREKKRMAAEEKFALFRDAEQKLLEFDSNYKKQFGDQMKKTQLELVGEIGAVIKTYAKQNGIRIVFDSSGKTLNNVESVIYYDAAFDITEPILTILNKNAPNPETSKKTETETKKNTP